MYTLEEYGVTKYISFDLASSEIMVITQVMMKGFTYGTGEPIAAGGRYDKLLAQFGKNASAIGFAIYMDQILIAHSGKNEKQITNMK